MGVRGYGPYSCLCPYDIGVWAEWLQSSCTKNKEGEKIEKNISSRR